MCPAVPHRDRTASDLERADGGPGRDLHRVPAPARRAGRRRGRGRPCRPAVIPAVMAVASGVDALGRPLARRRSGRPSSRPVPCSATALHASSARRPGGSRPGSWPRCRRPRTANPARPASASLKPGAGHLGVHDLGDGGADHAGEGGVAAADVDAGDPARACWPRCRGRRGPAAATPGGRLAQSPAAHTPSALVCWRRSTRIAPADAERRGRPRRPASALGATPRPSTHQVGGHRARGGVHRPGLEAARRSVAVRTSMPSRRMALPTSGAHVGVEGAPSPRSLPLDHGDLGAPAEERLGHLQADVAAADDDDVGAAGARRPGRAGARRRRGSARRARGHRRCPGRSGRTGRAPVAEHELVEAEPEGAARGRGRAPRPCRRRGRWPMASWPDAHVDALLVAELLGRAGHQVVEARRRRRRPGTGCRRRSSWSSCPCSRATISRSGLAPRPVTPPPSRPRPRR